MREFSRGLKSVRMTVMAGALLALWYAQAADITPEPEPKSEHPIKPAAETAVPASADTNFDAVAN